MIASLTKTAAQEVGGRDTGIYPDRIGTLHAHAFRALDRPTIAEGKEGLQRWNAWVKEKELPGVLRMAEPGSVTDDPEWKPSEAKVFGLESGEAMLQLVGVYRARATPKELWNQRVLSFSNRWEEFKSDTGMIDFTDLIEMAYQEIEKPPGSPKVMMLDEAQDMSRLEFQLARKWANTCEQAVTVGDPDQCLYAWRGTDPEAMTGSQFASRQVLARSYRVPAAVHAYAIDWINRVENREPVEYRPRLLDPDDPDRGEAQGEVHRTRHTWRRPEGVLKLVEDDLESGMSVMLLSSCGFMLAPSIDILRERGRPFYNPFRPNHGGWNPMRGAARLKRYLRPAQSVWGEDAAEWNWADVQEWLAPMQQKGYLVRGVKGKVAEWAKSRPLTTPTVDELASLFSSSEGFQKALELDVPWWRDSLLAKDQKVQRYPSQVYLTRGGPALQERPRLILGTIHSVKGGEADSVYVWPSLSRAGFVEEWDNPRQRAATYRLFYVAFTRAREKLTLCGGDGSFDVTFPRPE